ncbi:MAG: DUF3253 domain-containing protein [Proteobacteria bacterium]|nr:DUF3253 domain-containing protein [Pseudomonadota bacterium]
MVEETSKTPPQEVDPSAVDPIAQAILDCLQLQDPPADVKPVAVAKFIAEKRSKPGGSATLWRRYLAAVGQQAKFLARLGRIQIIHRGEPVDPKAVKGLVRYRLVDTAPDD